MPDAPTPIAPVINPDAPARILALWENRQQLASKPAGDPVASGLLVAFKGGLLVAGMGLLSVLTSPPPLAPRPGSASAGAARAAEHLHWIGSLWPYAGAAVTLLAATTAVRCVIQRRKIQSLNSAAENYVLDGDLAVPARALLARAQQAQRTVLGSQVHRLDLIDRQRNEVVLPVQVWEIASALREYSRLSDSTAADSSSAEVVALQAARRQALRVSRDGVEQRIVALEEYAAQVCEADLRYQELQQIQSLVEGNDEALDLLARTAADALAVAEIEAMSTEAAIVAKTFSTALDRASAAAVIALPTRATA